MAVVRMAVQDRGSALAATFPAEAAVIRSLIVGHSVRPGKAGVEFQPLLQPVANLHLKRVVALVGSRGTRVDTAPVGE